MRHRLPILLAALMMLSALIAAGCGDDEDAGTQPTAPTQTSTAPTPETSSTGSTGATGGESTAVTAKRALDNCLKAADQISDDDAKAKAKQQCQSAYENIEDATKKIDEQKAKALENCKQAAEAIPDEQTRQDALAACERLR